MRADVEHKIGELREQMASAPDYDTWIEAAVQLDVLEGREQWKAEAESGLYDTTLVRQQLKHMKQLRLHGALHDLMFSLRTCLYRSYGGINHPELQRQTHVGTKYLIDDYISEMVRSLESICDNTDVPLNRRIEFFNETRHHFGRTALLLSGGASLGMYHFGVIKALHEAHLLPRVISGSSAGALVAAFVGTHTDDELPLLCKPGHIRLDFFHSAGSLRRKVLRFFKEGYLMDMGKLQECAAWNLGNITFQEAYDRTRRILNITVSPTNKHEVPQLLNYLTAPNVVIWSAACASCALPGVFPPVELVAKDAHGDVVPYHISGTKWCDGSIENDLPMARLSEMFNVNHFIVSQVNPHVLPFIHDEEASGRGLVSRLRRFVSSEIKHRCLQLAELDLAPRVLVALLPLLMQKYEGHITIKPAARLNDYRRMLSNPTQEFLFKCTTESLRNTWPKLSMIRTHCRIECTLDECWRRLCALMDARNLVRAVPVAFAGLHPHTPAASQSCPSSYVRRVPSWVCVRGPSPPPLAAGAGGCSRYADTLATSALAGPSGGPCELGARPAAPHARATAASPFAFGDRPSLCRESSSEGECERDRGCEAEGELGPYSAARSYPRPRPARQRLHHTDLTSSEDHAQAHRPRGSAAVGIALVTTYEADGTWIASRRQSRGADGERVRWGRGRVPRRHSLNDLGAANVNISAQTHGMGDPGCVSVQPTAMPVSFSASAACVLAPSLTSSAVDSGQAQRAVSSTAGRQRRHTVDEDVSAFRQTVRLTAIGHTWASASSHRRQAVKSVVTREPTAVIEVWCPQRPDTVHEIAADLQKRGVIVCARTWAPRLAAASASAARVGSAARTTRVLTSVGSDGALLACARASASASGSDLECVADATRSASACAGTSFGTQMDNELGGVNCEMDSGVGHLQAGTAAAPEASLSGDAQALEHAPRNADDDDSHRGDERTSSGSGGWASDDEDSSKGAPHLGEYHYLSQAEPYLRDSYYDDYDSFVPPTPPPLGAVLAGTVDAHRLLTSSPLPVYSPKLIEWHA